MIAFIRIDDRLIHGQVVTGWTRRKSINYILAVDDKTAADTFQCRMMRMAIPAGCTADIKSVDDAVAILNSGKYDKQNVFIITKSAKTLLELESKGITLTQEINVGNLRGVGQVVAAPYIIINDEEIAAMKELSARTEKFYARLLPDDKEWDLKSALSKL